MLEILGMVFIIAITAMIRSFIRTRNKIKAMHYFAALDRGYDVDHANGAAIYYLNDESYVTFNQQAELVRQFPYSIVKEAREMGMTV